MGGVERGEGGVVIPSMISRRIGLSVNSTLDGIWATIETIVNELDDNSWSCTTYRLGIIMRNVILTRQYGVIHIY